MPYFSLLGNTATTETLDKLCSCIHAQFREMNEKAFLIRFSRSTMTSQHRIAIFIFSFGTVCGVCVGGVNRIVYLLSRSRIWFQQSLTDRLCEHSESEYNFQRYSSMFARQVQQYWNQCRSYLQLFLRLNACSNISVAQRNRLNMNLHRPYINRELFFINWWLASRYDMRCRHW